MQIKREMTVEAKTENLAVLNEMIEETLMECGCPFKAVTQLCCAAEEIFVNIANYAYAPETGSADICLEVRDEAPEISLTFSDAGRPYDPLAKDDPDVTLPVEERSVGGLGIFMVKKLTDDLSYKYEDGRNILCLRKSFQGPKG